MFIYQLHEYIGEYEDFMDRIIGTYLHEEKAIKEKEKLEKEEVTKKEMYRKCQDCPICNSWDRKDKDNLTKECREYCELFDLYEDDEEYAFDCNNYMYSYGEITYEIKKVEVIE